MRIFVLVLGLAITVILIPSLGLAPAFIVGVVTGGTVGFILQSLRGENIRPQNGSEESTAPENNAEQNSLAEVRRRLEKIKKIMVPTEASYLADIVVQVEAGNAQAYWNLGEAFLHGKVFLADPFPKDKRSALFWFRKSAELGSSFSQYHLGIIYLGDSAWQLGLGYSEEDELEKNIDEAVKWLRKAASQSDTFGASAQIVLGEMHFSGIGVSEDHAQAFDLFSKALSNPENLIVKMGVPTRAWDRLEALKAEGYA
jgi:hypothetical protein